MAQGNIKFNIGFNVDKSGLNDLKTSLYNIQQLQPKELIGIMPVEDAKKKLKQVQAVAQDLEKALNDSFNPTLNTYNIDTFKKKLNESGRSLKDYRIELSQLGARGQNAFQQLADSISSTKLPLQESHNLLKSMGTTLMNTVKWSIASNAVNTVTGSVQKAWSFTKQLDTSLNDIMIVTGKSADEMDRFAQKANNAAKSLGSSTKAYADAALIYYQQGLSEEDVAARAGITIKAANVTGQSAQAVSEQLTAVWNGYKVSAAEAELYIDKVAAVAAETAADLEELSTGMSKVASAANAMGVDIDQLNAQLATIVSVTRQDSAVVGTALKTIYSRMGDLMIDGEDEFGIKLGEVSSNLKTMGIEILDSQDNLRDMGEVIEEVAAKWDTWTDAQQQAAAVAIAGKRQYNNLIALFENWDMYESAKRTSEDSIGTLQEQQDTYMESLEAHFEKLSAEAEELYLSLFNAESFKDILDILTTLVDKVGDFTDALGGGGNVLAMLVPLMGKLFSASIADSAATFITNFQNAQNKAAALKKTLEGIDKIKASGISGYSLKIEELRENITKLAQSGTITNEVYNQLTDDLDAYSKALQDANTVSEKASKTASATATAMQGSFKAEGDKKALSEYFNLAQKQGLEFSGANLSKEEITTKLSSDATTQWYRDAERAFERISEHIDAVTAQTAEWSKLLKQGAAGDVKALEKGFEAIKKKTAELKNTDAIGNKGLISNREVWIDKALARANKELADKGQVSAATMKKLQDHLDKYQKELQEAGVDAKKVLGDMQKEFNKLATGGIAEADKKLDAFDQKLKESLKRPNFEAQIQQWVDLTSNIGMAISALKILDNLGDIWDNEDLTLMEKLGQSITNIATTASMLMPIIVAGAKAWKTYKAALIASNAEEIKKQLIITRTNSLMDIYDTITARASDAEHKRQATLALVEQGFNTLGDEVMQEIGITEKYTESIDENTAALLKNKLAQEYAQGGGGIDNTAQELAKDQFSKKTVWQDQVDKVKTGWGNFQTGWNASKGGKGLKGIKGAFSGAKGAATGAEALGAVAPYLLGVVAVAAVAIAAGVISKSVNEREEKAWTKAKEQVEATNQALAQTKQEYENLTSSISNLQNLETSMDDMVEGSVEWQKALAEVNSEVLQLLETYPELAGYIERQENGMLKLSAEGAELAQQKALDRMQAASVANMQAKIKSQNAEEEYLANEFAEAKVYGSQSAADAQAATPIAGAIIGGIIGIFGGPAGMAIGATIGAAAGGAIMAIGESSEEATKDELRESGTLDKLAEEFSRSGDLIFASEETLAKALDKTADQLTPLEKALLENKEEAKKLVETYAKNQVLERQQYIESGRAIAGADVSEGLAYVTGYQASLASEAAIEQIRKEMGGGNKADKEAAAKYLAEVYGLSADAITGAKGANKVQYTKDGGSYELDMDTVYGYFASLKGAEATAENVTAYANAIEKLEKVTSDEDAQKALNQLATGAVDFSKLTKESLDTLSDSLTDDVLGDIAKLTGKTIEELREEYEDSLQDSKDAWDTLNEGLAPAVQDALKVTQNSSLNLQQAQQYRDLLVDAWDTFGIEGVNAIHNMVAAFGNDSAEFISKMLQLDWTSKSIESDLLALANDFNVTFEDQDAFNEFLSKMKILKDYYANFDIKHLEEQYANLESVRNKLKDTGDIISADEFEKLGAGWDDYFVKMADGTYALTKSAEEFARLSKEVQKDTSRNALQDLITDFDLQQIESDSIPAIEAKLKEANEELAQWQANLGKNTGPFDIQPNNILIDTIQNYQQEFLNAANKNGNLLLGKTLNLLDYDALTDAQKQAYNNANQTGALINGDRMLLAAAYADQQIKNLSPEEQAKLFPEVAESLAEKSEIENRIDAYETELEGLDEFTDAEKLEARNKIYDAAIQDMAVQTNLRDLEESFNYVKENADLTEQQLLDLEIEKKKYADLIKNARENFELEYNKYELQEARLKLLDRELKKWQDIYDASADKDKISSLKEQNKLLEQQIEINDQLAIDKKADATAKYNEFEKAFRAYGDEDLFTEIGVTPIIDKDTGRIANIEEIMTKATAYIKDEGNFDTLEAAEASESMQLLKDYLSLLDEAADAEEASADAKKTILKNNADIIQQTIDNKAKIKDLKLEYQDFQRSLKDEDDYAGIVNTYIEEAKAIEEEALSFQARRLAIMTASITPAEKQAQLEALNQEAQEAVLALKEAEQNVEDQLIAAIEARSEAYDEYIEKIKTANDLYETQIDLNKLLYGEESSEFFGASVDYYNKISQSYNDILDKSKQAAEDAWNTFDALRAQGLNEEDEAYQSALEDATTAIQTYYENLGEAVEAAQNAYFAVVDAQLWQFEQGMTGNLGLGKLSEQWDWQQKLDDKYLDAVNREFEISALAYEFNKAISSTTSLNAQKRLNEAREEELKILREKDKLTQYDLDRAKLRLEITQAEIALQEAQANKTQMRLTRGADGTYSYQYVADMNEVEEKQQELAELNNELYNLDKDQYKENLEEIYDIFEEYIEKIREVTKDGIITDEELKELEQFRDYLKDIAGNENSDIWQHLEGLMTKDGIYGKLVESITGDTFDTLESELKTSLTAAGQTYTDTMSALKDALDKANNGENGATGLLQKFGELTEATDTMINKMNTAINGPEGLLQSLGDINGKYRDLAGNLQAMINQLQEEIPKLINGDYKGLTIGQTYKFDASSGSSVTFWDENRWGLTGGVTAGNMDKGKYKDGFTLLDIDVDEKGTHWGKIQLSDGSIYWVNLDLSANQKGIAGMQRFDTGGYTGEWNSSDGRLAMLHKKELVLNEDDTSNFLSGIQILRSLDNSMFSTMGRLLDTLDFGRIVSEVVQNETIEQKVEITANFPHATDKDTIIEAINEVVNLAAQQATKNSRQ